MRDKNSKTKKTSLIKIIALKILLIKISLIKDNNHACNVFTGITSIIQVYRGRGLQEKLLTY